MDDPEKAADLLKSFQEAPTHSEKPRKCPICDRKMAKIVVGSAPPILLLDKCRRGDGLWFDQGELQDVLQRGQLDSDSRIQTLLAEMFGRRPTDDDQEVRP
jgi:Zn-finger nucleic acid-binding protein